MLNSSQKLFDNTHKQIRVEVWRICIFPHDNICFRIMEQLTITIFREIKLAFEHKCYRTFIRIEQIKNMKKHWHSTRSDVEENCLINSIISSTEVFELYKCGSDLERSGLGDGQGPTGIEVDTRQYRCPVNEEALGRGTCEGLSLFRGTKDGHKSQS